MDRFYIDCEFDGHNGPLLSMAIIPEVGSGMHIRTDQVAADSWVRENVVPLMDRHDATRSQWVPLNEVGASIRAMIGDCAHPVIVCDSPQDSRYFSQAITTAPDGGYAPFSFEALTLEVVGIDCYPTTLEGAVQHNAWWDAMALREKLRSNAS